MNKVKNRLSDDFHIYYEKKRLWETTTWLGVPIWKLPFDAFVIQELIYETRPDYIIETGTGFGGSALFYASIQDMIKHGRVISVDVENKVNFKHKRIKFLISSSIDNPINNQIYRIVKANNNMVILDSWHTKEHVLKEIELYAHFVGLNNYLIIEDTHMNGNPIKWKWGDGPMEAVKEFLKSNKNFIIDKHCERLGMTFNPNGYLKRIK